MQVKLHDFGRHLKGALAPVYLVSGDETLLVEEACDAVSAAARTAGYTERSVFHADPHFKWGEIIHDSASLSLFAEKKLIDLRVPNAKFDKEATATLKEWIESLQPDPDTLLLIRCGRIDGREKNKAWFKAVDGAGVVLQVWPVETRDLPRFLAERLRRFDQEADPDALTYLAEKVEGNLLAASQEIHKLSLMGLAQPIGLEEMIRALEDSSRFTSFDALDAMMMGDPARVARVLEVLKEEGLSPFALLGALTSQVRRMRNPRGLPPQRIRLLERFASRIRDEHAILSECALIDQQGKGQRLGDAWHGLENLMLRLAGQRDLKLPSEMMVAR